MREGKLAAMCHFMEFWGDIVVDRLTRVMVGCHFDSCKFVEKKLLSDFWAVISIFQSMLHVVSKSRPVFVMPSPCGVYYSEP